jgi:sulfoxide reductase heme-binding subunit YedZ
VRTLSRQTIVSSAKALVFAGLLIPYALIVYAVLYDPISLGANPAEAILHKTGDWILNCLVLTLAVTPLRRMTGVNDLIRFRRMFGLFAAFYAFCHVMAYLGFDRLFDLSDMAREIVKRPFILVGFLGFLILIPLTITSTRGWVMRLGGKVWARLHKGVYAVAVLGSLHYIWLVKRDLTWPLIYSALFLLLFLARWPKPVPRLIGFDKRIQGR